jgi:hypothetical protein
VAPEDFATELPDARKIAIMEKMGVRCIAAPVRVSMAAE